VKKVELGGEETAFKEKTQGREKNESAPATIGGGIRVVKKEYGEKRKYGQTYWRSEST